MRESSTKPGQFVLSTRSTEGLKHFIIQSEDVSIVLAFAMKTHAQSFLPKAVIEFHCYKFD